MSGKWNFPFLAHATLSLAPGLAVVLTITGLQYTFTHMAVECV